MLPMKKALMLSSLSTILGSSGGGGGGGNTWAAATDWTITGSGLIVERTGSSTNRSNIHSTNSKLNGTLIITPNVFSGTAYPNFGIVGVDDGTEVGAPGFNNNGVSLGYLPTGEVFFCSSNIGTFAALAIGVPIKFVQTAGGHIAVFNNNILQVTVDTADAVYGAIVPLTATIKAVISNGSASVNDKYTADFTGF